MHLTRRHRRRLVAKFRRGIAVEELSTEFGITVGQVRAMLQDAGEDVPPADRDRGGLVEVFGPSDAA